MSHLKGIIFACFSLLAIQAFPQEYDFRNFSSEDGLTQSYVYSIIQDESGYLWIGTDNGLTKYNGITFENFETADSLAGNITSCSIRDGKGVWFGNTAGGLSFYDGKKFLPVKLPYKDASRITHFAKSPGDHVWASTYSGSLLKLDKDSGIVCDYILRNSVSITSFSFITENELLIGTTSGLNYCRINMPGEIEIIRPFAEIPKSKITGILKMRKEPLFYIATETDGLYQLGYNNKLFEISEIKADDGSGFTGIQDIDEDIFSDLWISTFGEGLIRISRLETGEVTKIRYFNKSGGFASDNVKTVYEDREGNFWCGSYGNGMIQLTPKTFSVFTFDNPLYGHSILSFCFSGLHGWIGSEKGLIKTDLISSKAIKFYGKGSGLPKDSVTALYSYDGKELWIGTGKNGLYRMDTVNETFSRYPLGNGLLENSITSITGSGDKVWIGTRKGLCSINSFTGQVSWYTINQGGLPHNNISGLYMDAAGRLWVSTSSNALSYIEDEKVFKIPSFPVNGSSKMGPVTQDHNSVIWAASSGSGVFVMNNDSLVNITLDDGLLSNYCYSVICDEKNNIWVGHKSGLSKIRTTDFSVKPLPYIESSKETYQYNPNAILEDQNGRIWFGTDKGIVIYDPSMEYPLQLPPPLVITSILINDEKIDIKDKIILRPGRYKIRIDFLGISLKEPELVSYQYRLEGYDQWSDITNTNYITYNRLTPGEYTFILNARSGNGDVTENPLTINIIIKTPFWMKWWFYAISLLLLLTFIFLYIKRREYKFLTEKRILEEKVRERTHEIQCQKDEIELQRDLINAKNANITSSIRYASHIQDALLPPSELVDSLLPDNFILNRPKDIVSGDFFWLAKKGNKIVFTVADCTGHGVPGAFMSLLGITFLNEIVNIEGLTASYDIVTRLREKVIYSLHHGRKDITSFDGMDLVMCVLDKKKRTIQYTGAMNDLVYIRDGKLNVIKADKSSVCALYENTNPFTIKEIRYKKGDVFYLYSDGYQDQFGGENDKKFLIPHFHLTLLEIHRLPMPDQKIMLENKLVKWMNNNTQTDDITVMGIRF